MNFQLPIQNLVKLALGFAVSFVFIRLFTILEYLRPILEVWEYLGNLITDSLVLDDK
jgi:hypothetical protein